MSTDRSHRTRRVGGALGVLAVLAVLTPLAVAPAAAADLVPITGAGSTWSQVAVDAWRADVRADGLVVNYSGTGSTDGRVQYMHHTVDFAVSEIPFENPPEPGQPAEVPDRPYRYLPIVAGGTSFMYHLTVGGKQVRDLRLSGETLTKIYTGVITRWNDPAIKADYGKDLPDEKITPVIRSDGAGASAQFSKYMQTLFPSLWCPFAQQTLRQPANNCHHTSFYPAFGSAKGQVGSNGVANYVSASYGEGAIGYVEYAYAKRINYPVVSLLNAAGYYSQPTASNVAVALTKAVIKTDLTQDLSSVYANPDSRTYPMSSYSYMIIPTTTDTPFNADKGRSLSTFINYFLCAGQQKAQTLGYSPLPKNLVLAGFQQVAAIPSAVASPGIDSCKNPALSILQSAPLPPACAKKGAPMCDGLGGVEGAATATTAAAASGGVSAQSGGVVGATGAGAATGAAGTSGAAAAAVDPLTGSPIATGGGGVAVNAAQAISVAPELASGAQTDVLYVIAAVSLLGVVIVPPSVIAARRRRPQGVHR
ncbi:MAG: phosphate ABC transporter substrate-binding protein PstS [Actinomycetes bacterium]